MYEYQNGTVKAPNQLTYLPNAHIIVRSARESLGVLRRSSAVEQGFPAYFLAIHILSISKKPVRREGINAVTRFARRVHGFEDFLQVNWE